MDAEKYSDSIGKKIFIKFLLEKKKPPKKPLFAPYAIKEIEILARSMFFIY
jgi:hypothetical protein